MLDEPHGTKQTFGLALAGFTAAPLAGRVIARIAPMLGSHLAVRLEGAVLAIFWVLSDVCDREERRDGHER